LFCQDCDIFHFRKAYWEKTHRDAVIKHWYTLQRGYINYKASLKNGGWWSSLLAVFEFSNIKSLEVTHLYLQGGN
jgi:hypothetical protein